MRGPVPREELRLPLCLAFGALLHGMEPKQAKGLGAWGAERAESAAAEVVVISNCDRCRKSALFPL